jgi:hypothetical protein
MQDALEWVAEEILCRFRSIPPPAWMAEGGGPRESFEEWIKPMLQAIHRQTGGDLNIEAAPFELEQHG